MGSGDISRSLAETLAVFDAPSSRGEPFTANEVAEALGCGRRTAYDRLERLADRGEVETKKVGARGRVWWRPPDESWGRADDLRRELDEMFQRIDDAFFALDDEWRFTYVNDRAEDVLDRRGDELLGESIWDAFPGTVDSTFEEMYREAMAEQQSVTFEEFYPPLDTWFEVAAYPSETGLSVHFQDVTERKAREQRLELYETIVETIWDGVYALDPDERFVMANDAFLEMTGYDRDELLGERASVVHSETINERAANLSTEFVDEPGGANLEFELRTGDGETIPVESRFGPYKYDDDRYARTGVVRDVTDQRKHEAELTRGRQELQKRERSLRRANEIIADPDRSFSEQLDDLLSVVREAVGTDYATLSHAQDDRYLFEAVDVPADADLEAGDSVPLMATVCERVISTRRTHAFSDLEREDPELAERVNDADWGISCYLGAPVSVDGDVYGTFCFYDGESRTEEFSDWEVTFIEILANWMSQELERQRNTDRLTVLNSLNTVVRRINEAIVSQSTREEIERTVCESLAASDSYEFAWIAEVDPRTETVTPRVEAGVDGYLDAISLSMDPDDETAKGPTARAIRDLETQVVRDAFEDPSFEPWRDAAREYGYRASAAIPIVHEGTLYGIIGVYADRDDAFAAEEREVVGRLGEMVGHAIVAVERKQALMSDDLTEVEFRIRDLLDVETTSTNETISLDRTVPVGDGEYLTYGTAAGAGERVKDLTDQLPHLDEVTILDEGFEESRFELRLTDPPVLSTVAGLGGYVDEARIEDGDYHLAVHLPPSADVRQIVEPVQEAYSDAEMVTRRQVRRPERSSAALGRTVAEELTDRQVTALEAAFYSGFFEWPRNSSGEEIADSLGVAPATFHQHLRNAERKIVEALFADHPRLAG